jgi:hypothetical protein
MKMAELVDPMPPSDVVVGFNSKTMRTNRTLPKGYPKSMHPVLKRVGGGTIRPSLSSRKCSAKKVILGLSPLGGSIHVT